MHFLNVVYIGELRIDLFQKAAELDDHFYNYSSR